MLFSFRIPDFRLSCDCYSYLPGKCPQKRNSNNWRLNCVPICRTKERADVNIISIRYFKVESVLWVIFGLMFIIILTLVVPDVELGGSVIELFMLPGLSVIAIKQSTSTVGTKFVCRAFVSIIITDLLLFVVTNTELFTIYHPIHINYTKIHDEFL